MSERGPGGELTAIIAGTSSLRQALTILLERTGVAILLDTGDVADAAAMARDRSPDVLLMEIGPAAGAVDAQLRELAGLRPAPRIVAVCRGVSPDDVAAAVKVGIDAIVTEDCGTEGLLDAFEAVRRGQR